VVHVGCLYHAGPGSDCLSCQWHPQHPGATDQRRSAMRIVTSADRHPQQEFHTTARPRPSHPNPQQNFRTANRSQPREGKM
jgi:hypothetical protein